MSKVLVTESYLTDIGNAIRAKNKGTDKYKPNEMAGAIKALALDNSVVIQSNDAWKYAVDPALEHQSITVKVNADLIGDNTTGYTSKTTFDPTIKSNFGYIAGKIKQTVDSTNHIINFSAGPVTETDKLIQDGWAPVYIISTSQYSKNYYTTTTPDDVNSFKSISSSDNIENILICGYYTKDNSTGKLSPVDSDKNYVGNQLLSTYTKKIKNTYATSIGDYAFNSCSALTSIDVSNATSIGSGAFSSCSALTSIDVSNATSIGDNAFNSCSALTSIDVSNATSIGNNAFSYCNKLTSIDVSNATSIGDSAFSYCNKLTSIDVSNATSIGSGAFSSCSALTSIDVSNATSIGNNALANWNNPKLKYIVIDSNTVSAAHVQPWSGVKVLIPQSMMSAYAADSYWSSYTSYLDAIENYTITRENGQITVTKKN